MKMLAMSMHPSDEALSRLADQSELERMRSRAGRHAARCARCSAELAAIAALGEAARGMPAPALPPALVARVATERSRAAGAPPAPIGRHTPHAQLALVRERPRHWMTKTRGAVLAAAAAIVVAVLAWPAWQQRNLAAASHGTATIYPRYPRPGATIGIRFVPAPEWSGRDTLWAEAYVDLRHGHSANRASTSWFDAVLLRDRDGAYRGRAILPVAALSGDIRVMTEPPGSMTARRVTEIVLLTSDSSTARPSLDAMESAVFHDRSFMVNQVLADAFARWAPDHPMRWLVANDRREGGTFDWLKFFDNAERRFARLTTRLDAKPDARPGELAGMAALAYRIEEPAAAAEWTERLMREHPDNPWAFALRIQELHEMELRRAPRDSIARLLPSLDTLYERSGARLENGYFLSNVIANNADSATIHRWAVREARAGRYFGNQFTRGRVAFSDRELRDSAEAYAREVLADTVESDPRYASFERARAYSTLAAVALARGEYRRAVSLTDSARVSPCVWMGQDSRAIALLALGDTAEATPSLAVFGLADYLLNADSVRHMLGSHFNAQRWRQAVDSVEAVRQACRRRGR